MPMTTRPFFASLAWAIGLGALASLAACSDSSDPKAKDAAVDATQPVLPDAAVETVADAAVDVAMLDAAPDAARLGDATGPALPTLFLVGDSTVSAFNDPYYYPRYGYGTQIAKYLQGSIAVNNLALSGRSSKSFINPADNGNYALLKASIKAGDFLMIGFGHNDEKADDVMYTNPTTDLSDPASFQAYLNTYYVQVAKAAGATPILVTPIVRRSATAAYTGAKVHVTTDVTAGTKVYPGGDYSQAIRDLGASQGVTVIDGTALTLVLHKERFAAGGAEATAKLQAWVGDTIASVDDTHTNIYGAAYYAYLIAKAVAESTNPLQAFVLPGITPPDAAILVPNPAWKPIAYTAPVKGTVWKTTDPWWGSVFGDVGGATKITDGVSYGIAETSTDPLVVTVRSGSDVISAGKIAAASDGLAFYFQAIPVEKDFTLSATATVKSITYNNSQVGFGLMVRDAVWMDVSDITLFSSYVACGPLKGNTPASAWSSFTRDTGAATQLTGTPVTAAAAVPATGSVVELKITKSGAIYTCAFDKEPPKTTTLDLNAIDSAYVYAGLFTARAAEVSYSNITLTVN